MADYKAVIFDIDGVVADTVGDFTWIDKVYKNHFPDPEEAGFSNWEDYLSTYGVMFRKLSSENGEELLENLNVDSETAIETYQATQEKKDRIMDRFAPFQDAVNLLEKLDKEGFKIAAVSNASEPNTRKFLEDNELAKHFNFITGASIDSFEEFRNEKKPNPDMLNDALESINLDPEEAVMIGDSSSDKVAAEKAGVDFISLNRGQNNGSDKNGRSVASLDDAKELLF